MRRVDRQSVLIRLDRELPRLVEQRPGAVRVAGRPADASALERDPDPSTVVGLEHGGLVERALGVLEPPLQTFRARDLREHLYAERRVEISLEQPPEPLLGQRRIVEVPERREVGTIVAHVSAATAAYAWRAASSTGSAPEPLRGRRRSRRRASPRSPTAAAHRRAPSSGRCPQPGQLAVGARRVGGPVGDVDAGDAVRRARDRVPHGAVVPDVERVEHQPDVVEPRLVAGSRSRPRASSRTRRSRAESGESARTRAARRPRVRPVRAAAARRRRRARAVLLGAAGERAGEADDRLRAVARQDARPSGRAHARRSAGSSGPSMPGQAEREERRDRRDAVRDGEAVLGEQRDVRRVVVRAA